jgi:hypothetical protein
MSKLESLFFGYIAFRFFIVKGKGKGHPKTGHEGPEGE